MKFQNENETFQNENENEIFKMKMKMRFSRQIWKRKLLDTTPADTPLQQGKVGGQKILDKRLRKG